MKLGDEFGAASFTIKNWGYRMIVYNIYIHMYNNNSNNNNNIYIYIMSILYDIIGILQWGCNQEQIPVCVGEFSILLNKS